MLSKCYELCAKRSKQVLSKWTKQVLTKQVLTKQPTVASAKQVSGELRAKRGGGKILVVPTCGKCKCSGAKLSNSERWSYL